jgi:calcineurin-like phosphoesterase
MDVACGTVHTTGQQVVDSDVRLNSNGTIYENDAGTLESKIGNALAVAMNGMVSQPALVVVNRTNNIAATGVVLVTVTIYARGYILEIDVTLQYNNTLAS